MIVKPPHKQMGQKKTCSKPCPPVQVFANFQKAVLVSLCFLYLCLCSSVVGIVPSVQRDFLGGGDLISKNDGKNTNHNKTYGTLGGGIGRVIQGGPKKTVNSPIGVISPQLPTYFRPFIGAGHPCHSI